MTSKPNSRPWHLRPRTPKDCPLCQGKPPHAHHHPDIIPWSQVKSKRGCRKELVSEGHACPNKDCLYYGIIDQHIHALVGDEVEGVHEPIQWWRCQACGERFSERHDTVSLPSFGEQRTCHTGRFLELDRAR